MKKTLILTILMLVVLATTANCQITATASAQASASAGSQLFVRLYEPVASSAAWFNQHLCVVYSNGSAGDQTDIVRPGNFLKEMYIEGNTIRVRRCGNRVHQIGVQVEVKVAAAAEAKAGVNGRDGRDGCDGTNGRDGKDGINGRDGRDGRDGCDGRDGRDGIDGLDGTCIIYSPFVLFNGRVFSSGDSPKHHTWINPGKKGFRDYLMAGIGAGIGGFIANRGIRPDNMEISLNNASSSNSSATQHQGQHQGQQQGQEQNTDVDNVNNNVNNNDQNTVVDNENNNTNNQGTDVDVDTDIGIVNNNAAAANASGGPTDD